MFIDRLSDVTLLILVHVKNILFDAACRLLIGPRNEGISYSGREKSPKKGLKLTSANESCQPLFQVAGVPSINNIEFVINQMFHISKIMDARHDIHNPQELTALGTGGRIDTV